MRELRSRVLVVEDDAATREGLVSLLEGKFEVIAAATGEEAVEVAKLHRPDVVLADLSLPGMDGLTTLESLRQQPGLQGVPAVFLSGVEDEATVECCLNRGATDFIPKPAQARELVARITRAVRQRQDLKALELLAKQDALTGLANFRSLAIRLEEEFKRAERYDHPLALVMLDLDHLKKLNDQLGHEAGNQAIQMLAQELTANLRETDFAARFGGDEFIVLLPHQSSSEAAIFAERLRARLNDQTFKFGPTPQRLSISVGVASRTSEHPKNSPEHLLQAADAALYEAKRLGRNRMTVFEREMNHLQPAVEQRH